MLKSKQLPVHGRGVEQNHLDEDLHTTGIVLMSDSTNLDDGKYIQMAEERLEEC